MVPQEVMRAQISSLHADSTHSAISDVHDNNAVLIDFHTVADSVTSATSKIADRAGIAPDVGTLRQFWDGVVEDIIGPKKKSAA